MDIDDADPSVPAWMAKLGIVDRVSGIEKARNSRQQIVNLAGGAMGAFHHFGGMTVPNLVMMGLASRALGLHDAAVAALEADNPFAAFTLIRAYAENAAAAEYAIEKPKAINQLMGMHGSSLPIGRIVSHAMQSPNARFGEFKAVYGQLSGYAHPTVKSIFVFVNNSDGNGFDMSMTPSFKSEKEFLTAASWIVEFANASTRLLVELAAYQGEDDKIVMQFKPPMSDGD
jgi:hypothetical protein